MKKNFKEKKFRQNKGITLIALIITIIVLLILAGVSIMMLAGENGILKRAGEASETTKEANAREKVELAVMETLTEKNGVFDTDVFENEVKKAGGEIIDQTEDEIVVEMDGYEVTVDAKTGEIKGVEKAGGVKAEFETKLYKPDGSEAGTEKAEELVLTVDVTNEEEIGSGEIKVTVTAPNGENVEANAEVTGEGDKSFKVDQNGEYTVTVETTVDGITKKVTKKVTVNSIKVEFSRAYGTIDIRFINGTGDTATASQTANKPVLGENMKAINFNEETNSWTELNETESWDYSYTNEAGQSKWANAVVEDENGQITGYFVWIPRYAYKITYHSRSLTGEVVGYSDSRGIVNTVEGTVTGGENRRNAGDNFIVHPAFTNDVNVGGWGEEVSGIWVAKYEASKETSSDGTTWIHAEIGRSSTGNVLTTNAGNTSSTKVRMVSKPGVTSWRWINIGKMYQNAEGYNKELNSHLMKNSEWGAIAYLSYSNYGIGTTKVAQNTDRSYTTGGSKIDETTGGEAIYVTNAGQSTTGNAYGVYDMSGGANEFVASYVNNGASQLTSYGSSFATADKANAKSSSKVTVYKASNSETEETSDSQATNYKLSGENMFGDATFETSTSYNSVSGSWQSAGGYFPSEIFSCFGRGGTYTNINACVFAFNRVNPDFAQDGSFRPVLVLSP